MTTEQRTRLLARVDEVLGTLVEEGWRVKRMAFTDEEDERPLLELDLRWDPPPAVGAI